MQIKPRTLGLMITRVAPAAVRQFVILTKLGAMRCRREYRVVRSLFVIRAKAWIACGCCGRLKGRPPSSLKSDSCLRRNDDTGRFDGMRRFFARHPCEGRDRSCC